MRKTATKSIKLVLITSVLASCAQPKDQQHVEGKQRIFMRADTTAAYTEVTDSYSQGHSGGGMGSALLWFMAFRHLGGGFGYANNNLHPQSIAGTNAAKAAAYQAQRGGFGRSATSSTRSSYGS
ncbi:hypothetical protein [Sphingobacterium chuzhouense]|uniref:Lipoprotein n=1 Tax=Sphingobacterium chuzhouense TaxID=1742264 RepID=A0ABR7XUY3_9SPHI|nr:hypothetical protein [Sphingobacterium chuzhouense]MBD1422869.1 hypothetical protein [Sphingobacterium chuzhouense]